MMTTHEAVLERFKSKFDTVKHPLLLEYIKHWLFNNQFLDMSEDDMYEAIRTSVGMKMYLEIREIPEDDDQFI